jgi:hypothetical protein
VKLGADVIVLTQRAGKVVFVVGNRKRMLRLGCTGEVAMHKIEFIAGFNARKHWMRLFDPDLVPAHVGDFQFRAIKLEAAYTTTD